MVDSSCFAFLESIPSSYIHRTPNFLEDLLFPHLQPVLYQWLSLLPRFQIQTQKVRIIVTGSEMGTKPWPGQSMWTLNFNYSCEKDTLFPGVTLRKHCPFKITGDLTTTWEESVQEWSQTDSTVRGMLVWFNIFILLCYPQASLSHDHGYTPMHPFI